MKGDWADCLSRSSGPVLFVTASFVSTRLPIDVKDNISYAYVASCYALWFLHSQSRVRWKNGVHCEKQEDFFGILLP